jgi:hypothetical protein
MRPNFERSPADSTGESAERTDEAARKLLSLTKDCVTGHIGSAGYKIAAYLHTHPSMDAEPKKLLEDVLKQIDGFSQAFYPTMREALGLDIEEFEDLQERQAMERGQSIEGLT